MKSRRSRKYRKIEIVDNKVNLVNLKVDKWAKTYDWNMSIVAKGLTTSMVVGAIGLVISLGLVIKEVIG